MTEPRGPRAPSIPMSRDRGRWPIFEEPEIVRIGTQALAIEFPDRISDPHRQAIREQFDEWSRNPRRPLLLEAGARLRSLDADGRITPNDVTSVVLPWWSMAIGAGLGAFATLVLEALT